MDLALPDVNVAGKKVVAVAKPIPRPRSKLFISPATTGPTREIAGFEALARWNHPTLGPVPPREFIDVAEQTGTITALSEQIFDAAIREAACWTAPLELSINLSGIDLCRSGTPHMMMATCIRYGFDPRRLQVEVTETSVLSDFDVARDQIDLVRTAGIRVALDDFGSGYASISYLKEVTFDRVKINGELIADIITSPKAQCLVQGILQLCSAMRLPMTAEKIESEAELAILVGLGCDRFQGYLISRPVRSKHWTAMSDAGASLCASLKVPFGLAFLAGHRVDLRNHRKIVVIDGQITYCGSQNCADPAFLVKKKFAPWVDIMIRYQGPIVWQAEVIFASKSIARCSFWRGQARHESRANRVRFTARCLK